MQNRKYILILLGVIILVYLTVKKYKMEFIIQAVKTALQKYPREIVENAERIFRLETAHFKSNQFKATLSPGMEKFSESFPYGWNTINKVVWSVNPALKPIGFKTFTEGSGLLNDGGKVKTFLSFPNMTASFSTVCEFLLHYNNNPGRWFSTDILKQQAYNKTIASIKPKITSGL
ncbi:MAG: hypothetical protein WC069_06885 [Candidatus Shapirobacteria bacterium]